MDTALLEHICTIQYAYTCCGFRIYKNGKLQSMLPEQSSDAVWFDRIPQELELQDSYPISLVNSFEVLLHGCIREIGGEHILWVGPVLLSRPSAGEIIQMMHLRAVPSGLYESVAESLHWLPVFPLEHFLRYLSLLHAIINRSIINPAEIIKHSQMDPNLLQPTEVKAVQQRPFRFHANSRQSSQNYDTALNFYIRNGLVDEIKNLEQFTSYIDIGKLGPNYLRSLKNSVISLNTLCVHAATSGGLDYITAYTMGEEFSQRIEDCQTIDALSALADTIRMDFCQRVHEISHAKVENPHLIKASRYIVEHIHQRITAGQIAEHIGISKEYLSSLFREGFGCSIPDYVNQKKIEEAKKMLVLTRKSLVEISNALGYTNQSYFQNQFKRICGTTPTQYRNSNTG